MSDREPQWWDKKTKWAKEFSTYSKQELVDYANEHYNPYTPSRQKENVWGAIHELYTKYGIAFGD